jgi:tRNA nucleotidyltransferase/poly(A) polymerase
MDERIAASVAGEEAYVVGGALRDELLGRPVLDVDVACRDPYAAARRHADASGSAVFALSDRHGAWRVALAGGHTVDFTPLKGSIEDDLATRDFTVNAIARALPGGEEVDPLGGRADLEARVLRAVSDDVFRDDPLRLLRAVRLEDELGLRLDHASERLVRRDAALVTRPAGERILAELGRLSPPGWRRLDELGLLAPLGGSTERLGGVEDVDDSDLWAIAVLGRGLLRLPVSRRLERMTRALLAAAPPADATTRAIHRFRRRTEPWALEALAYLGARSLAPAVEQARAADPDEPLLRGDELGLPPGPEIGRLLERIEEERAAGTIATRDEALELARRERGA